MTRSVLVTAALLACALNAGAQQSGRAASMPARSGCPAPRPFPTPTAAQRRAARALAERGQQSAILGDRSAAREQLRQAAVLDPSDPELAYQLARAHDAAGANVDAAAEYCRFLSLSPSAPEAAEARERIVVLAPAPPITSTLGARLSPSRALSLGLVLPGAGQFYTGRPVAGALSLGAAVAAVGCGLHQSNELTPVQETALDPFGNPYTYTATRRTSSRPCLVPGLAAAGIIAVTSALEASRYARHANEERRVAVDLVPDHASLALRVTVR